VHGSAPKFAGKNIANPIGAISSAALMLKTLSLTKEAAAIDAAVLKAVHDDQVTSDIGGKLGTTDAGSYISRNIT
jgi:isocitrate/isopropylmalate dehydrogenase